MRIRINAEIEIDDVTENDKNKLGYAFTWLRKSASGITTEEAPEKKDANSSFSDDMHEKLVEYKKDHEKLNK